MEIVLARHATCPWAPRRALDGEADGPTKSTSPPAPLSATPSVANPTHLRASVQRGQDDLRERWPESLFRPHQILQILLPGDRVKYGHGQEGAISSNRPRCPLGRKGVADLPPLAYARNWNWTDLPFLQSLRSTTALFVQRSHDENRVLNLVFVRKRTELQVNGRSSFMDDRCARETTKKNELPFSKGRGWECAKLTLRERFSNLNFVFGNLLFFSRSPYSTACSQPSAKLGSQNWTLGGKVSRQIDHRGPWSGRQKYFLVANGD